MEVNAGKITIRSLLTAEDRAGAAPVVDSQAASSSDASLEQGPRSDRAHLRASLVARLRLISHVLAETLVLAAAIAAYPDDPASPQIYGGLAQNPFIFTSLAVRTAVTHVARQRHSPGHLASG